MSFCTAAWRAPFRELKLRWLMVAAVVALGIGEERINAGDRECDKDVPALDVNADVKEEVDARIAARRVWENFMVIC